jgi:hypothetical protein
MAVNIPWPTSEEVCQQMARDNDTVVLFFSRGKDAVAAWLQLRRQFKRVVPVNYYLVPNLQFELDSLKYFEEFFETPIYRLPSPHLYKQLALHLYQPPSYVKPIDKFDLPQFDWDTLATVTKEDFELPPETWAANGVRMFDSFARIMALKKNGPVNLNRRLFYPVYDWTPTRLKEEFRASKVQLPIDYKIWGRSFDGLSYAYMEGLRKHLPEDYERVKQWFPLVESVLKRMEYRRGQAS